MKRSLVIICAVAGYAMIDTALLLSVIVPPKWYSIPRGYTATVALAQLLIIPGMAALFSYVIYGSFQWKRRTLSILLAGILGVPLSIIAFLLPAALLAWAVDVNMILFYFLLPIVLVIVALVGHWCVKKSGKWGVQADAARWLGDRRSGLTQRDRTWRRRGVRSALWIPSLIALPIFLFLPETWGILSHLGRCDLGELSGFRASTPATWIVVAHDRQPDGRSWINGLAGRGVGLGGNPLRLDSLSSWDISTRSFDQSEEDYDRLLPKENKILSRLVVTIGNDRLACLDYWPLNHWGPARSDATLIAYVECFGTTRLRASFYGRRDQLPRFYQMLSGITKVR